MAGSCKEQASSTETHEEGYASYSNICALCARQPTRSDTLRGTRPKIDSEPLESREEPMTGHPSGSETGLPRNPEAVWFKDLAPSPVTRREPSSTISDFGSLRCTNNHDKASPMVLSSSASSTNEVEPGMGSTGLIADLTADAKGSNLSVHEEAIENMQHSSQLLRLEKEFEVFRGEFKEMLRSREATSRSRLDISAMEALRYENSLLKQQLQHDRTANKDTTRARSSNFLGPGAPEIREDVAALDDDIAVACAAPWDADVPFTAMLEQLHSLPDLQPLLKRVLGINALDMTGFRDWASTYGASKLQVKRSLAAAFLSTSVFEAASFSALPTAASQLDEYREEIMASYGAEELRWLDLRAHKSWLSSKGFEVNILKTLASRHAYELVKLLVQLREHDPHDLEKSFQSIFEKALRLKGQLELSNKRYKLVFPPPGSSFEPQAMKRDGSGYHANNNGVQGEQGGQGIMDYGQHKVKLCLFPAIFSYDRPVPHRHLHPRIDVDECVLERTNFFIDDAAFGGEIATVVTKAVVLV
ncbi:Uu.00g043380.m01.CDS01 [Anthostomella pinea]|uniref:Uu.00g043380.m01.CDS01 n=1 Tax=Anthostomella pinea TaxID=933095 RepID=A0AAI8VAS0_9PEZI|nr:Uu.00g043380.m01.CDS01 [Anthostomella pinea]